MNEKIIKEGLTFDDVLLIPSYSNVLPHQVSMQTQISPSISLKIPMISAAMDTVTEADMAISIAREGGLGIIHKNMSIEEQKINVIKVKRSENGIIRNPVTLEKENTIEQVRDTMSKFNISGIIIVDEQQKITGIVTHRDLRYTSQEKRLVGDIMTKENLVTAPEGVGIEQARQILAKHKIEKLPIVDKDMKVKGLITMKDIQNLIDHPNASKDKEGRLQVGAAVGNTPEVLDRVQALVEAGVDLIAIDSAHGHSQGIIDLVKKIKTQFPKIDVMVGNIVTAQAAEALIDAGADTIKVGIGPGSICTTRVIAGVGMPQITAVMDVAAYCKSRGAKVVADGGIKFSGDLAKAIAAGADAVMLGSLLAGTDEAPGEEVLYEGRKFKSYIGMGSIKAMKRGSGDRYFQEKNKKLVPEGIESMVPYKGNVKEVLFQLCGGLRASMGYCGTHSIGALQENAQFVRITGAGLKENHPHSVILTKEAPNYSKK